MSRIFLAKCEIKAVLMLLYIDSIILNSYTV